MKLSAYAYTNRGGREKNEDSIRCSIQGQRGIFIVADGLGGHQSGEVASALAADVIFSGCEEESMPEPDALVRLFQTANQELRRQQEVPGREDMKTTAVALCLDEGRAVWAHIGDSRLYHFSDGELTEVTKDHSVTYKKFLGGEISYMDVYHDDDRSSLLRVLGKEKCQPESGEGTAAIGDAFLLCSDGFWEYVYNEEMEIDLCKAEGPEDWARRMLLRHIRRTPSGNDNFSLITILVEEGS